MVGDILKMLLPSYQKTFNFVNTDTPCRKKAKACEKTFTKTVKLQDSKTSLATKLLANANLLIFHKKEFLLKLSISISICGVL